MDKKLTHGELQQYLWDCREKRMAPSSVLELLKGIDEKSYDYSSTYKPDFYSWIYGDNQSLVNCINPLPIKKVDIKECDHLHFNSVEHLSCFLCLTNDFSDFVTNDCFTIYYHLSGDTKIFVDEKNLDLMPGTMVIIPPRKPYTASSQKGAITLQIMVDETCFNDAFFYVIGDNSCMTQFFSRLFLGEKGTSDVTYFIHHLTYDRQVHGLFQAIFNEYYNPKPYNVEIITGYLRILFTMSLRNAADESDVNQIHQPQKLLSVFQYMEDHYDTVTLYSLAEHFHYSTTYLSKLIHQSMGMSFREILITLRMDHAKLMLKETDRSVIDISGSLGYKNPENFSRNFKEITGLSPRDYRKKYAKGLTKTRCYIR